MPFGLQPWHIIVVVIVALIVFGPSKLPELGRSVGKTINEFRTGAKEMTDSMKEEISKGAPEANSANVVGSTQSAPIIKVSPAMIEPTESASVSTTPTTFCGQCGTANPSDARFCKSCGKAIAA